MKLKNLLFLILIASAIFAGQVQCAEATAISVKSEEEVKKDFEISGKITVKDRIFIKMEDGEEKPLHSIGCIFSNDRIAFSDIDYTKDVKASKERDIFLETILSDVSEKMKNCRWYNQSSGECRGFLPENLFKGKKAGQIVSVNFKFDETKEFHFILVNEPNPIIDKIKMSSEHLVKHCDDASSRLKKQDNCIVQ